MDRQSWRCWSWLVSWILVHFQRWHWHKLQNQVGHLLLGRFGNPEEPTPLFFRLRNVVEACKVYLCFLLSQAFFQSVMLVLGEKELCHHNALSCWVVLCSFLFLGWLFWELLGSGTGLLLVSFSSIGSVLGPDFRSFTGDVCDSISIRMISLCNSNSEIVDKFN